jgi:hypothetical protein
MATFNARLTKKITAAKQNNNQRNTKPKNQKQAKNNLIL